MTALLALQIVHTIIFWFCAAMLGPVAWYALTGENGLWAVLSILPPAGVFAGILINRGECILQTLAKRMTGRKEGWERDILWFPESVATKVVSFLFPVYATIIAAAALRYAYHLIAG